MVQDDGFIAGVEISKQQGGTSGTGGIPTGDEPSAAEIEEAQRKGFIGGLKRESGLTRAAEQEALRVLAPKGMAGVVSPTSRFRLAGRKVGEPVIFTGIRDPQTKTERIVIEK